MSNDAKGGSGFSALLAEYENAQGKRRAPRVGAMVDATVVAIGHDAVFVDLGAKAEGVIDRSELLDDEGKLRVAVGDRVRAHVVKAGEGAIVLRTRVGGHKGEDAGAELEQAHNLGLPVQGVVKAVNKGGVEVEIGGVRAFCPISQLDASRVEDASEFVGRELTFRVTRFERGHGKPNVVLSRRAILEQERAERAAEAQARIQVGDVVRGKVTSLKEFGAFIDLGGIEGLLHRSELGLARGVHPSKALAAGDEIDIQVVAIEPSADPKRSPRISLRLPGAPPVVGASSKGDASRGEPAPKHSRSQSLGSFADLFKDKLGR